MAKFSSFASLCSLFIPADVQDGRIPQAMMWDAMESKLLAVQTLVSKGIKGVLMLKDGHFDAPSTLVL